MASSDPDLSWIRDDDRRVLATSVKSPLRVAQRAAAQTDGIVRTARSGRSPAPWQRDCCAWKRTENGSRRFSPVGGARGSQVAGQEVLDEETDRSSSVHRPGSRPRGMRRRILVAHRSRQRADADARSGTDSDAHAAVLMAPTAGRSSFSPSRRRSLRTGGARVRAASSVDQCRRPSPSARSAENRRT